MFSQTETFYAAQSRAVFLLMFISHQVVTWEGWLWVIITMLASGQLSPILLPTPLSSLHCQPEREAWAKIIKAIFSLKNVIIWNIMMAVNSWLITIKRRIKLPLVPPGGTAAISTLEHYYTIRGWLACCLTTASSHLTLWEYSHFTFMISHPGRPCQDTNRTSMRRKSDLICNINSPFFHNS